MQDLLEAREHAIAGWFEFFQEQEADPEDRIEHYLTHGLPAWLVAGLEYKFAPQTRRVTPS